MNKKDVDVSSSVIEGALLIYNNLANVLFDAGSTKSIVCPKFSIS